MKLTVRVLALFLGFQSLGFAFVSSINQVPTLPGHLTCLDLNHEALPFQNEQVMQWKVSTPDQTIKRALIEGTVTQRFSDHSGHVHFAINIDIKPEGDIEVIYNNNFGSLPSIQVGMRVIACGDYITVGPRARRPSPMGAIIHWVHYNPGDRDGGKHKHGFLIINEKPFGTSPAVQR